MADQQHLYLLKQDLSAWNEWRKNNPEIDVNLIDADLSESNLNGADLSNVDLSGAKLISADLSEANLSGAYMSGTNLSFAKLTHANLSFSYLCESDLSFASLDRANFSAAYVAQTNLTFADLTGADLSFANLSDSDLSESNAESAKFCFADLSKVVCLNANLIRSDFKEADLNHASFIKSNLSECNFIFANLSDTNLSGTLVNFTNFKGATFNRATLENWKTNSYTILDDIICDCVYLKSSQNDGDSNRSDASLQAFKIDFSPGEFTRLFQKNRETIQFSFATGIDWHCFLSVFKSLKLEWDSSELSIKAIEAELSGSFIITVEGYFTTEKKKIEDNFWLDYNSVLADRIANNNSRSTRPLHTDRLLKIIEMIADRFDDPDESHSYNI